MVELIDFQAQQIEALQKEVARLTAELNQIPACSKPLLDAGFSYKLK